ncbi:MULTISPECIES: hypothetical protein [unclassified Pasteurella]|uniref:hypothetical protein n=1 Tax=unclassified Pasteurella TaxID=2621516 RepID=UPI00107462C0|nr:hypothetical protein [Pasteurella sp. 19428wF3_WM03]TFU50846.1 hypothetical protein E4T92_07680 [Pasteurella sp. WM03]
MYTIIGFHTCEDRGESNEEIKSKVPIKSEQEGQWLGAGYYFWTDSYRYARTWGTYNKRVVSEFDINFSTQKEIFDLVGNASHQEEFENMLTEMVKKNPKLYNMDMSAIFYFFRDKDVFEQYKAIKACNRCEFKERFFTNRPERLMFPTRIQLCLFEKNVELILKDIIRDGGD